MAEARKKITVKQEKKLQLKNKNNKKNLKIMNQKEVINFMQTYQRIMPSYLQPKNVSVYSKCLKIHSKYASIIMSLNNSHQINKIKFN